MICSLTKKPFILWWCTPWEYRYSKPCLPSIKFNKQNNILVEFSAREKTIDQDVWLLLSTNLTRTWDLIFIGLSIYWNFLFRLRSTRSWTICGLGTDYRFEDKLWRTYNVTFPTPWQTQIYSFSRSVLLVLIPLCSWKLSWNDFMFGPGSH